MVCEPQAIFCVCQFHNDTFCTSSFMHERSFLFVILQFLGMVFSGSLPRLLGAKAQQSLSVDMLLWSIHLLLCYED